jgi:hypothetical protein
LTEIDGLVLTDPFANTAFFLFQVKTGLVDVGDQGNGLSEIDMDGFVLRYFLIELIRIFDRAVFNARRTPGALALDDVPGLSKQGDLEISSFPCDALYFRIRQDFDVWMPADLDQFGREDSDGAVIGRKGLIQLGHVAADGRRLVDQVNLETRPGKIKGGLNTADSSAHNHHISKIAVCKALTKLFNLFFFQFRSPHERSKTRNSNIETRNKLKFPKFKNPNLSCLELSGFGDLRFFRISDFVLRI